MKYPLVDIKVSNLHALSNTAMDLSQMNAGHKNIKKPQYKTRIIQLEKGVLCINIIKGCENAIETHHCENAIFIILERFLM